MVPHDVAHGGLGDVAKRAANVAYPEQVFDGIVNLVLDDPLHGGHVQVAGQHDGLLGGVRGRRVFGVDPGPHRPEAKLFLELALHGDLVHGLDAERQLEPGARSGGPVVRSEARHHADFLGLHLEVRREHANGHHEPHNDPPA